MSISRKLTLSQLKSVADQFTNHTGKTLCHEDLMHREPSEIFNLFEEEGLEVKNAEGNKVKVFKKGATNEQEETT